MQKLDGDFDTPVLIKHIGSKEEDKEFKSKIHELLDDGILNPDLKILKSKKTLVVDDIEMQPNDLLLCTNDLESQLRRRYSKQKKCIKFDDWRSQQKGLSSSDTLKRFLLPSITMLTQTNYQR